jgi:uncharacterized damage-inducible protein DinB
MRTFFLFVGFALFAWARLSAQDSLFIQEAALKWSNAAAYTLEVARAMPPSQYNFRPTPEEMTFGEQLTHMAENMMWLSSSYLTGIGVEHPLLAKKERSPDEIIALMELALNTAQEAIRTARPEGLSESVDFFAGPMTRRQIILLLHDHHTHHRGQIIVYLRLNGIKPPRYRGW